MNLICLDSKYETSLIQSMRGANIIFAVDSSADTIYDWLTGNTMMATYKRSINLSGIVNDASFPSIPGTNTFVNLDFNTRPMFFSRGASNTLTPSPLLIYLPKVTNILFSEMFTFYRTSNSSIRNNMALNG